MSDRDSVENGLPQDALPCCNETEPDGIPCAGTMRRDWPEYVCGTCGGRCGALVHPTHRSNVWPGTDAHRYAYCLSCSAVVRDFNRDEVWRDREGHITCDHQPPAPGSTFHAPSVLPPGETQHDEDDEGPRRPDGPE